MNRLFLCVCLVITLAGVGRGQSDPSKPKAKVGRTARTKSSVAKQRTRRLNKREAKQSLAFARTHHPELAKLISRLKNAGNRPAYDKAVLELFRTAERLERAKVANPKRYELMLELWKLESQARLMVAQQAMKPDDDRDARLKRTLRRRAELRREMQAVSGPDRSNRDAVEGTGKPGCCRGSRVATIAAGSENDGEPFEGPKWQAGPQGGLDRSRSSNGKTGETGGQEDRQNQGQVEAMTRYLISSLVVGALAVSAQANDAKVVPSKVAAPVPERFAAESTDEVPDFQRHVVPLFGKLGCSGRACHGSFQGRGGFRLSLFGYDFKFDHDALLKAADGEGPRANVSKPTKSLMLEKPTETVPHEGGLRMKVGSWQYRLLRSWIAAGAPAVSKDAARLVKLEITPAELVIGVKGEKIQLKAVAVWSDGTREDVTPLTRFKSNDDLVADVSSGGLLTSGQPGDTHVVAFYDNGVVPVPVVRPVSDKVGKKYPKVETPTEIDRLVVDKLRKLGIVPSDLSTDAEFLRRVSLDLVGTLPTVPEITSFLENTDPEKRTKKVEELLARPAYAAWWATRLSDFTGNNDDALNNVTPQKTRRASQDWYDWLQDRVTKNVPYDKLVEGLVMATSRNPGESFKQFSKTMSGVYREEGPQTFIDRQGMSHYWARRTFRQPQERAIGFAYTFLGIRIQCAQCHKHPFDQWTKDDFAQFQGFFTGVNFGTNPKTRTEYNELMAALNLGDKKGGQARKAVGEALLEGKTVPFQEVYVISPKQASSKNKKNKNAGGKAARQIRQQLAKQQQRSETARPEWQASQHGTRGFVGQAAGRRAGRPHEV